MSMATKHPETEAPGGSAGYERRDAKIGPLLQFALLLAVVLASTLVGMRWTLHYFVRTEPLGPPAAPAEVVNPNERVLPPSPRLQAQPHLELKEYCQAQETEVSSYGWVDQTSGVVRIPVSQAMDLLLARGLPVRPASEAPTGEAEVVPAPPTVEGGADVRGPCAYLAGPGSGPSEGQTAGR